MEFQNGDSDILYTRNIDYRKSGAKVTKYSINKDAGTRTRIKWEKQKAFEKGKENINGNSLRLVTLRASYRNWTLGCSLDTREKNHWR